MKTFESCQLGVICFIWSNVAENEIVKIGAAFLGMVFIALPAYYRWKK